MKLVITKTIDEARGELMPKFFGVAYVDVVSGKITYALIPLNVIMYYYQKLRHRLKTWGSWEVLNYHKK